MDGKSTRLDSFRAQIRILAWDELGSVMYQGSWVTSGVGPFSKFIDISHITWNPASDMVYAWVLNSKVLLILHLMHVEDHLCFHNSG